MATLENTYYAEIPVSTTGASGIQYFPLSNPVQPVGSVFVIKSIFIQSDVGIGEGSVGFNYILYTSDDDIGTNESPICCDPYIDVPSTETLDILQGHEIIVNKPYMGLNISTPSPGTIRLTVCYSLIPSSNALYNTFINNSAGPTTGSSSFPMSSDPVYTNILKSIVVMNSVGDATYEFRLFYRPNGGSDYPISSLIELAPYESAFYSSNFFMQPSSTTNSIVNVITGAGTGLTRHNSYISYT